jgi:hypothetical protein
MTTLLERDHSNTYPLKITQEGLRRLKLYALPQVRNVGVPSAVIIEVIWLSVYSNQYHAKDHTYYPKSMAKALTGSVNGA